MKKDELIRAYEMVYNDLMEDEMCRGVYDAKDGDVHFMYGISCVLSAIARKVSPKTYEEFSDIFFKNLVKSQKSVDKENK